MFLRDCNSLRMRLLTCSNLLMLARFLFSLRAVFLISFLKTFGILATVEIGQLHFPPILAHPQGARSVNLPETVAFRDPLLLFRLNFLLFL